MPSYFVKQIESNLENSPSSRSFEKFSLSKFSIFDSKSNRTFTFITLCICSFFSNLIITGSSTVVLSTLEKEFFLTSFESGFFLALFELGGFVSSPFFGFFGSLKKFKKLHLISLSLFFLLIGSYLIGFLIFFKQPALKNFYNTTYGLTNLCSLPEYLNDSVFSAGIEEHLGFSGCLNTNVAREESKNNINYKLILYVGHFFIGLGSVAIYTVGIAYVEEIALENKSPLWQGILYGTGSIGGGIGFLISGQFLTVNSRFFSTTNYIQENSINWIGAWWLPYLIYGTICGILAVLITIKMIT
ncbi:Solute carrier organic anion transporter family member [Brachionus plicatilis]|uniref:Solute carrier organic anion transporter family member n=1 Tax=Brachionus plicatilis TaxID=10195 RepID=A0A3M7SCH0_BRAPC|nr:Solute carrier organic anion transporter family member [Brachionus plicatilis]